MIRKLIIPALALGFATTAAQAEEHVWKVGDGFTIRAGDLDLASRDGRAALLRRVDFAAGEVCREVTPRVSRRECAETVTQRALAGSSQQVRTAVAAARIEQDAPRLAGR